MERNTGTFQHEEEHDWSRVATQVKSFDNPDEVRAFPKGRVEIVNIEGSVVGRAILEPGWRWSESVGPIANTRSCQAPHFQYHVAGTLEVLMDDGRTLTCRPGDVSRILEGHDAWVVGDEPVIIVDFQGMAEYARRQLQ